jgi:hypothetical protein
LAEILIQEIDGRGDKGGGADCSASVRRAVSRVLEPYINDVVGHMKQNFDVGCRREDGAVLD